MLNNPKTTIAGYLTLAASLFIVVAHVFSGGLSMADITAVIGAISGLGLIAAQDASH
jgi:hypothetical protein